MRLKKNPKKNPRFFDEPLRFQHLDSTEGVHRLLEERDENPALRCLRDLMFTSFYAKRFDTFNRRTLSFRMPPVTRFLISAGERIR